ncbi:hypothetical protein A2U01_0064731, partial [Trifolium medium]|nr:hypothetical protein [Trifolium medium]
TLTPHYDPRVEEFVVNEVLSVFKQAEEEEAAASEHDPLVLILQEQLPTQKAEQELLKEEVKNLTESQHHVI